MAGWAALFEQAMMAGAIAGVGRGAPHADLSPDIVQALASERAKIHEALQRAYAQRAQYRRGYRYPAHAPY